VSGRVWALAWVRGLFEGTGARIEVDDLCEGALPGAHSPIAERFLAVARSVAAERGCELRIGAKVGWTDVARFSQAGVPADFRHFKATTLGGALIMGRITWESIGSAPPGTVLTLSPRSASSPHARPTQPPGGSFT